MRVLHWSMLGVTILLLVCEVTINHLCKSLIILVDGFHTLFLLVRMAFHPQPACKIKPPPSSLDCHVSPPHNSSSSATPSSTLPAKSSIKTLSVTLNAASLSTQLAAAPQSPPEATSSNISPPALACGLSYTSSRTLPVGAFISTLVLVSLCISYLIEIINFFLAPEPIRRPLLLVVFAAVSVLLKTLVIWLNWDQLLDEQGWDSREPRINSRLEVSHKVLAEEAEPGRVLDDISHVQSAVEDSLHNGGLVLCNLGTSSSLPDIHCQTPQPQPEIPLHAEAPLGSTCIGHAGSQKAPKTCTYSHHIESPVPSTQSCLPSLALVTQGLCSSILALINSLVMLLISPQLLHGSGACSLLLYLDPGLSLLAVIMLIATATLQVQRYGLLLLQATPPHICVSDLGRRIASVPGVQAVHDLHVWQLTESFLVASVHVHCHAGFPANRCADLMSGVTKVLRSVGVTCCTVQPEFAFCSGSSAGSRGDASPIVHREDPSMPPLLPSCRIACGKACAGNMCCSPPEKDEETRGLLAPPAGETKEEPQTLVIENTFL